MHSAKRLGNIQGVRMFPVYPMSGEHCPTGDFSCRARACFAGFSFDYKM